jgi:hypothetical protein
MAKGQQNNAMANRAYFQREAKRRSIAGATNRELAYEDINEKVRDKNFNLLVDPHGTLNLDQIDNNQFQVVKGPGGVNINEKRQSQKNQSGEHFFTDLENPELHPEPQHSQGVSDIAKGMRLALGIPEPVALPLDRKASRQLTRIVAMNRPVANKTWSKEEIHKFGVYSY